MATVCKTVEELIKLMKEADSEDFEWSFNDHPFIIRRLRKGHESRKQSKKKEEIFKELT